MVTGRSGAVGTRFNAGMSLREVLTSRVMSWPRRSPVLCTSSRSLDARGTGGTCLGVRREARTSSSTLDVPPVTASDPSTSLYDVLVVLWNKRRPFEAPLPSPLRRVPPLVEEVSPPCARAGSVSIPSVVVERRRSPESDESSPRGGCSLLWARDDALVVASFDAGASPGKLDVPATPYGPGNCTREDEDSSSPNFPCPGSTDVTSSVPVPSFDCAGSGEDGSMSILDMLRGGS